MGAFPRPLLIVMPGYSQKAWDLGCLLSIVGIWPRYIEPEIICLSRIECPIKNLPFDLDGFRIVQFSDLHLSPSMSDRFLKRMRKKTMNLKPDLIVFTGDFLCYSKIGDKKRLEKFLNGLKAPYGCFAILGNHDYKEPVLVNTNTGEYDVLERKEGDIAAGLNLIFHKPKVLGKSSQAAKEVDFHPELMTLLKKTPFRVLHNEHVLIKVKNSCINIVGLGEHMLGKDHGDSAWKDIDATGPTIALAHNPDTFPSLMNTPADLILSGHTHGAQINLPGLWNHFTLMENPEYKRGLFRKNEKTFYVSRGVGSVFKFRLFSVPEITLFTLRKANG